MQENYQLVQEGFRILIKPLSEFIGQEMNRVYRNGWWDEVLNKLNYPADLPGRGTYGDLVDSLDIANCIRLIDWAWGDVFRENLSPACRAWARELMGYRNEVAHIGQRDLDQAKAERALDTMALLCKEIDEESAARIRELHQEVRKRDPNMVTRVTYAGAAQPVSESRRGTTTVEGSLLGSKKRSIVQKTTLAKKITFGGKTSAYPVYRVRLDALFYNDQNDRIATWISKYEAENGAESLDAMDTEEYNRIIEDFIVESNPEAIQKTQRNISIVGQREPGVTLSDGRIVDGNRRFTCLRRLQRESAEPLYFETVLLDMDIFEDRKQIKLLELAIQHGEEKKVDYDLIDYAIGTYRDVVLTGLLTVDEYAKSANEPLADVRKRIEVAGIISEFLEYIKLPGQYHVAREYQTYSLFQEMLPLLRQLDGEGKQRLKQIVFNNTMMKAITDQRKFIRDIKNLIRNGTYTVYFDDQKKYNDTIRDRFDQQDIKSKADIDRFALENMQLTEDMQMSMERALLRSRMQQLRSKPSENVQKCISLLMDVDPRNFSRMDPDEITALRSDLEELEGVIRRLKNKL